MTKKPKCNGNCKGDFTAEARRAQRILIYPLGEMPKWIEGLHALRAFQLLSKRGRAMIGINNLISTAPHLAEGDANGLNLDGLPKFKPAVLRALCASAVKTVFARNDLNAHNAPPAPTRNGV